MKGGEGLAEIMAWIEREVLFETKPATGQQASALE
jgi:hypothetical protein